MNLRVLVMVGIMLNLYIFIGFSGGETKPQANWVPAHSNNYTPSNRESTYDIKYVVIHVAQGSYQGTISWFQNSNAKASSHYVIGKNGELTQMVADKDIAWHAGNWDYNTKSIGIEHEGYVDQPQSFTDAMYKKSAHLVRWLAEAYSIPKDRQHIIGHNEVPDPNDPNKYGGAGHHTDPGPYWDWNKFMSLILPPITDDTPPPSPTPISPLDMEYLENATVVFKWTKVSDASGISKYLLQIDNDYTFPNPYEINLSKDTYSTSIMPGKIYYWHVKAIDSAGLSSDWSNTWSFTSPPSRNGEYIRNDCRNALKEPGFEYGLKNGWEFRNISLTHTKYSGFYGVRIEEYGEIIQRDIILLPSHTYELSLQYLTNNSSIANYWQVEINGEDNILRKDYPPSTIWTRIRETFTTPSEPQRFGINIKNINDVGYELYIDDVQVSEPNMSYQDTFDRKWWREMGKAFSPAPGWIDVNGTGEILSTLSYSNILVEWEYAQEMDNTGNMSVITDNNDMKIELPKTDFNWHKFSLVLGSDIALYMDEKIFYENETVIMKDRIGFYVNEGHYKIRKIMIYPISFFTLTLKPGWNFISIPFIPVGGGRIESIFGEYVDIVQTYHAGDKYDRWKVWQRGRIEHINEIGEITPGYGYWVHLNGNEETSYSLTGMYVPIRLTIYPGWNMVGYPYMNEMELPLALWNVSWERVEGQSDSSDFRISLLNPNDKMSPGNGYWIYVSEGGVWGGEN